MSRLILASQSPRRVEFIKGLGIPFECIPSHIDEATELTEPAEVAESLALQKAQAVVAQLTDAGAGGSARGGEQERVLVLGADTIVVLNNEVLGKPSTREHAYQMLMRMSGRRHRVLTGVSLIDVESGITATKHEVSNVYFRSLDPAEVRYYAKTEEPMDKAGAYALQGMASAFVEKIEGCYSNVIGLPMPLTVKMLRAAGLKVMGFAE